MHALYRSQDDCRYTSVLPLAAKTSGAPARPGFLAVSGGRGEAAIHKRQAKKKLQGPNLERPFEFPAPRRQGRLPTGGTRPLLRRELEARSLKIL
jgi:hypothetical protein